MSKTSQKMSKYRQDHSQCYSKMALNDKENQQQWSWHIIQGDNWDKNKKNNNKKTFYKGCLAGEIEKKAKFIPFYLCM